MEVTQDVNQWIAQDSFVERLMDDSAFTMAHPDDTLVLAGPARFNNDDAATFISQLLPLGMMVNMSLQCGVPSQPVQTLGSGRTFGGRGKSSISFSFTRLIVSEGRNALRALHTTSKRAGVDASKFDDPASLSADSAFYLNLDSEQFYIPYGLYILVSNKARQVITFFGLEASHITSWSTGFQAGQPMVMENVSGWSDRIVQLDLNSLAAGLPGRADVSTLRGVLGMSTATPDLTTK